MRVYLDNCCFNRPFDDQSQVRIRLEAEAKLHIQRKITEGALELAWSYVLDHENDANPYEERRRATAGWRKRSATDVEETPGILAKAAELVAAGLRNVDALHVACAIASGCEYFVTTDDLLLQRGSRVREIKIVDPPTFLREALQ
ncbi:MAG: type II toxin-antitoxin system VapC family toxin [Planctomycetes bacterium]|nr:type II toxin-antitoxin system VapC family toxin [Planctomycetota bacterium]